MNRVLRAVCVTCVAYGLAPIAVASPPRFQDVLDVPAISVRAPDKNFFTSVARAGQRLVAVGQRGLIVFSDDHGRNWKQARVPVQSDLTDVRFLTADIGWAVGHDEVVLRSNDGGRSWVRLTDGRTIAPAAERYYSDQVAEGTIKASVFVDAEKLNNKSGTGEPFLSVLFENASVGYAVGAFGTIEVTSDGGKTWIPWLDRIDNSQFYHLNSIRSIGGEIYVAGEAGMVYRLDRTAKRFVALPTGYSGSLFGITGDDSVLVAYGLRGNIFRSTDKGSSWAKVPNFIPASLVDGVILADGKICLVNQGGMVLVSQDQGRSFRPTGARVPTLATSIVALGPQTLLLSGAAGVTTAKIKLGR
jgi:photosystem II stability/assembly factor-like uncharacterized protein